MEQENSKAKFKLPLLILVIAIVVALGGAWVWHSHKNNSGSNSNSSTGNWTTYKNDKYGFMFSYPKAWGSPQVMVSSGEYQVSFVPSASSALKSNNSVTILFGSNKGDLTSNNVSRGLGGDKSKYVKYDSSSYALLSSDPKQNVSSELILYQIVSLPKTNVSAVLIDTTINGTTQCSAQLVQTSKNCITSSFYSDLNQFAKSIKST